MSDFDDLEEISDQFSFRANSSKRGLTKGQRKYLADLKVRNAEQHRSLAAQQERALNRRHLRIPPNQE